MRHGAGNGNAEHLSREDVGRRRAAADDRRPRAVNACIRSLRAAQAEFHDGVPLRGVTHLRRLGRDKRLMIDDVQKRRFHKLRFDDRRLHRKDRLPGENHGAFGDRRNIAGKTEIFQIFQKSVVKQTQAFQVFKFLFSEGKVFDIRHRLFQPDGERIGDHAVLTEKNIEYGDLLFPALFEIPVHHRQLVQIRKQRQIPFHNKMLLKGNGNRKAAVS